MPTIIALDTSYSMQRHIPNRCDHTYHQLAVKGISHLLDNLSANAKLEYVALLTYGTTCELKVDFTREYEHLRQAVKKIETTDKTYLMNMLKNVATVMSSNWGAQNICQIVIFTDCGVGFGLTSLKCFLQNYVGNEHDPEHAWLPILKPYKLNFICLGLHSDTYFTRAISIYQQLIDVVGLKGQLFMTKHAQDAACESTINSNTFAYNTSINTNTSAKNELGRTAIFELIERLCEASFKPLETVLKCGGYFKLECPVLLWPPPAACQHRGNLYMIEQKIEICGFLALQDIGSPASLSRHLILAKIERGEKLTRRSMDKANKVPKVTLDPNSPNYEYEKLESEIRDFLTRDKDTDESGDDADAVLNKYNNSHNNEYQKESVCVLLHNALKLESLAALVRFQEFWYGFIYPFTDARKKSNLMLHILPPGTNVIPWLGDLRMIGLPEDVTKNEISSFPVKAEKRSYAQSCVVWIRHASLQSDIQKVLRHAKKMPDKMQHFYKELNRIRRAALSIGFVELLEALATLLEKECSQLTLNGVNSECTLQLQHAAAELRKTTQRDCKVPIVPLQKFTTGVASSAEVIIDNTTGYIY